MQETISVKQERIRIEQDEILVMQEQNRGSKRNITRIWFDFNFQLLNLMLDVMPLIFDYCDHE